MICIKLSILIQMLRFFFEPGQRRAIFSFMAVVVFYSLVLLFAFVFNCRPISFIWDKTISGGHCNNIHITCFIHAACNIATDIGICILPIPMLKSLRLPKKQKYALMVVFMMGGL